MAEDFTTYTEVDPGTKITITATRVTFADLRRNEEAYVYLDKGVDYFAGNFTIYLTLNLSAYDGAEVLSPWVMANDIDDVRGIDVDLASDSLFIYIGSALAVTIYECDGGTLYGDASPYTITAGTTYYLKIVRDESVGTYGTLYLYIYSNSARTTLLDTLSVALHTSKKNFRYIYPLSVWNAGTSHSASGYVENLIIENWGDDFSTESPSVTTQATTDIEATTATGNGNVTALGNPKATQHGHCWATHPNPTTSDSTTTEGAPSATGAFTSSMTGLFQNTEYYARAYIFSPLGTFYGKQAFFTTLPGFPIVTTRLFYYVTATSVLGRASIDNNGGSDIIQHGVVWDETQNPRVDTDTESGFWGQTEEGPTDEIGLFESLVTNLTPNKVYHARPYATNDLGTGYGANMTFRTGTTGAPIVTTERTTNIEPVSALGNGTIVSEGGSAVTEHGHCWDKTVNPTVTDSASGFWGKTTNGAGSVGAFTSLITGLTAGQEYYIRAYATNSQGTSYGNNDLIGDLAEELRGNIAVKNEFVVYTDYDGTQRALLGVEF